MNRIDLTVIIKRNPEALVKIVMAPNGQRDKYAVLFYHISQEAINRECENLVKEILALNKDNRGKNKAIDRTYEKRDQALELLIRD